MVGHAILLVFCLAGVDGPPARSPETAADRVTLRDASVVLGLVTSSTTGPRGTVEFLVRRAWAEKTLDAKVRRWDQAAAPATNLAVRQRRQRLESWKRDRSPHVGPDDRIVPWIDDQIARLAAQAKSNTSILIRARVPRNEVRALDRQPAAVERLIRLAWLRQLTQPESMSLTDLKESLAARGVDVDAAGRGQAVSIDSLLPPAPETEAAWLARRAATEVSIDPDLRFVRYQNTVVPDAGPGAGQPLGAVGLETAMSELKRLLDLDPDRTDPLIEKLRGVAARGRVGAQVTRLEVPPDLSRVTVECTLWIRTGTERWVPFGSRQGTVRTDELQPDAGQNLAADPQVRGAFKVVEMLGLGSIPTDVKNRSLRIGAATAKAMGMARADFNEDLDALVFPIMESPRDDRDQDAVQKTRR